MAQQPDMESGSRPRKGVLLWDMAGTLIPFDSVTGLPGPLPGFEEFLPDLGQDFRLVITTGDETTSARGLLMGFGLEEYFENIIGNLFAPLGKPYGDILRQMGADPFCSLAIGDRLRADIASDTDQIVTILINQDGDTASAGLVALVIRTLQKKSRSFPHAFSALCEESRPEPGLVQERAGGEITRSWLADLGFPCKLMEFRHPALDGERKIIQI